MKASELIAMIDTACGHNQDTLAESDIYVIVAGEDSSRGVLNITHGVDNNGSEWVEVEVEE